ncbi:MAG: HEPN domain-containing protein [Armatimonadetes bacterium]|nr:HEPN domain-containing protein [Armatimonadota bacterium]
MDKWLRESIRRLQGIGDEDLAVARLCLEATPAMVRSAAFHCQQAAEKHLKAWLLALGELENQLTHSLPDLAADIEKHGGPQLAYEPLKFLTKFAVAPRYALGHVSLPEAEEALAEAKQVVETARQAVAALTGGDEDA